jgi:hypothetical protein
MCIEVKQLSPEIILQIIPDYLKHRMASGLSYLGLFYVLTIPKKINFFYIICLSA